MNTPLLRWSMMPLPRLLVMLLLVATRFVAAPVAAQSAAQDPSTRLRQVLPAAIADRVLAKIADARAHGLPADALAQRALKFAAKGVAPEAIERSVEEQSERMERAKGALEGRGTPPTADEVEAGAEAIRQGVDGQAVSELAKSAPSGRSLTVPLYVLGSLTARGLPSDQALTKVRERLAAHASDADLEALSNDNAQGNRPAGVGRDRAPGKGGDGAGPASHGGGPPAGVPANGGRHVRPTRPDNPTGRPPKTGRP